MSAALVDHLDRFQAWLRTLPGAPAWTSVRMVVPRSVTEGPVSTVPRSAVCTVDAFRERFDALLSCGYSWINLAALGVENDTLLVTLELPRDPVGVPVGRTSVNFSGPVHDLRGNSIWQLGTRIRVVDGA